jgi:hypothetical protein
LYIIRVVQGNNETIKKDALWWNLDQDGTIRMKSVLADVLKFYNKKTLKDFIGTEIKTEPKCSCSTDILVPNTDFVV